MLRPRARCVAVYLGAREAVTLAASTCARCCGRCACTLEAVSVLPQLRMMQNAKVCPPCLSLQSAAQDSRTCGQSVHAGLWNQSVWPRDVRPCEKVVRRPDDGVRNTLKCAIDGKHGRSRAHAADVARLAQLENDLSRTTLLSLCLPQLALSSRQRTAIRLRWSECRWCMCSRRISWMLCFNHNMITCPCCGPI